MNHSDHVACTAEGSQALQVLDSQTCSALHMHPGGAPCVQSNLAGQPEELHTCTLSNVQVYNLPWKCGVKKVQKVERQSVHHESSKGIQSSAGYASRRSIKRMFVDALDTLAVHLHGKLPSRVR